ncbi:PEP-CTERM sorting domain-containing protein [Novosphingobium sp. Chol11]|uniref:PEP-CTERM sorting domain-containing protein n=1 Tax=Novosphingobium sp. Chol11 TaxID=1385763 RepID=UPI0025FD4225|nr:PEP-CTERM sorting domain-containing protein [Novosphingobium sp. Chol11]
MVRPPHFLAHSLLAGAALVLVPIGAACAQAGDTSVPEPNNIILFAIGVLGLILGRRNGRRRD